MNSKVSKLFYDNLNKNKGTFFIVTLFFAIGIATGAFTVKSLNINQKQELIVYFNNFLQILGKDNVSRNSVFYQSLKNNIQAVLVLWFFGITVLGVIITLIVIAFKGFVTGFTISFLIQGLGWKGILACIITVLPQNIIYIPCLIIISTYSLNSSIQILKRKLYKNYSNSTKNLILPYTTIILFLFLIMIVGSLIEAYVSPYILKSLSSYLIK